GDAVEAELLYDLLEREVVPLFFARDATRGEGGRAPGQTAGAAAARRDTWGGLPRAWIKRMKGAVSKLVPEDKTQRMVSEDVERVYVPAITLSHKMNDDDLAGARLLSAWKDRVHKAWPTVAVKDIVLKSPSELQVGEKMRVEAVVHLGALTPADVAVELYH